MTRAASEIINISLVAIVAMAAVAVAEARPGPEHKTGGYDWLCQMVEYQWTPMGLARGSTPFQRCVDTDVAMAYRET